jgi:hypothetical protein
MTQAKTRQVSARKKSAQLKPAKKAATKARAAKAEATQAKAEKVGAASKGRTSELEVKPVKNLKGHTKKLIAKQFSEIMESMAEKSKAGSLAHAKFLFEIGGVKDDLAKVRRGKAEPSLADLLMGGVKLCQETNAAERERQLAMDDEFSRSHDEDEEMYEGAAD